MTSFLLKWVVAVAIMAHLPLGDAQVADKFTAEGLHAEKTEKGIYIFLPSTTFQTGVATTSTDQNVALRTVVRVLNDNRVRSRYIYVEGHTDVVGSDRLNMGLSQRRADNVLAALIRFGLSADRAIAIGYGSKHPRSGKNAENRRVQLLVYTK